MKKLIAVLVLVLVLILGVSALTAAVEEEEGEWENSEAKYRIVRLWEDLKDLEGQLDDLDEYLHEFIIEDIDKGFTTARENLWVLETEVIDLFTRLEEQEAELEEVRLRFDEQSARLMSEMEENELLRQEVQKQTGDPDPLESRIEEGSEVELGEGLYFENDFDLDDFLYEEQDDVTAEISPGEPEIGEPYYTDEGSEEDDFWPEGEELQPGTEE